MVDVEPSATFEKATNELQSILKEESMEGLDFISHYKEMKRKMKKMEVTMRLGEMYVAHLVETMGDLKEQISHEIEEIVQTGDDKQSDNYGFGVSKKSKAADAKVGKNVPNVRNLEKGLLKEKQPSRMTTFFDAAVGGVTKKDVKPETSGEESA